MTNTTKQALSEWTPAQLAAELERIHAKMEEIENVAADDEASGWVWEDMHDWTLAIANEIARRATVEVQA